MSDEGGATFDRDLDADQAICDAASEGPWTDDLHDDSPEGLISSTNGGCVACVHHHGNYNTVTRTGEHFSHADAAFIAAAREGWPACIAEVRRLRAELDRLLDTEPAVTRVHYTQDDGLQVEMKHWAVRHLAASLLDTFEAEGGPNYAVMQVAGPSRGPLEVVIRPLWGTKTPQQKLVETEAEVARLKAEGVELRCEIQRVHTASAEERILLEDIRDDLESRRPGLKAENTRLKADNASLRGRLADATMKLEAYEEQRS